MAGCGVAVAGRGRLEHAGNELFGKMVVFLFGGDAGPAPPWWWGRGCLVLAGGVVVASRAVSGFSWLRRRGCSGLLS
jgi:hypothetical protein